MYLFTYSLHLLLIIDILYPPQFIFLFLVINKKNYHIFFWVSSNNCHMALISIQRYIIIDVFWFISGYIDNFIIFCRFMYFFISSLKQLILKTNHFKHKNNCGFNKKVIDIKVLKTFQFSSVLSLWRFLYFNHSVNASRVHRGCVLNIFS